SDWDRSIQGDRGSEPLADQPCIHRRLVPTRLERLRRRAFALAERPSFSAAATSSPGKSITVAAVRNNAWFSATRSFVLLLTVLQNDWTVCPVDRNTAQSQQGQTN